MTAIVDTHPSGPRREARLGSWVARCRKAIARPLKALILYPMPISCSQASKLGHEQHRARIREVARQIPQETGQQPHPALERTA